MAEITVAENGMVELRSVLAKDSIYIGWLLGDVLHALDIADKVRALADQPEAEYALDIEVGRRRPPGSQIALDGLGGHLLVDSRFTVTTPLRLPLYSVEAAGGFPSIALQVLADMMNAGGMAEDRRATIVPVSNLRQR